MADRVTVRVRYFAAAADAAGTPEEQLTFAAAPTIADVVERLAERHGPGLGAVLAVSAYLVGDDITRDHTQPAGDSIDVLPPFAGG